MARYGMRSSFGYSRSVTIFRRSPQCPERFPCTHSTMHRLTATLLAFFFAALVLVSSSNAGPVPEASSGKRKRDNGHEQRYTLLKNLIERAAENNMPQN
ncbi:uncharacterized protein [Littorina saxatilis]|uniref:uncharacterized protein isoform X4 n=1 Tax=Littorina saxatilis TaxID=31220 RepID=UPI0038B5458F